ncbi:hypothetical protein GOP47_0019170 [Adiantum capillus-veneris]|uniref:Uncharacterized protein n=1 Tax=Adiantum capillus-veneris TaxID=13818 RepID=A0A9D4UEM4_ADICA|nr:hypothetical protein GOP47_0019170 [Adiantum capillus-veneris]
MPSSSGSSPERAQYGRERSKAAAWAWYQRGGAASGGSLCIQAGSSTALMVRGKYMQRISTDGNSRGHDNQQESSKGMAHVEHKASKCRRLPPSRFKQEADKLAAVSRWRCAGSGAACPQSLFSDEEDHQLMCGSYHDTPHLLDAAHADHILYSTSSSNLPSPSSSIPPLPFLHRAAVSADDPPLHHSRWLDSLLGTSNRKSTSSLYVDNELASLISFFGQGTGAAIDHRSSLFDSFELQAMLRKLEPLPYNEGGHRAEPQDALDHDPGVEEAVVPDVREADLDHGLKEAHVDGLVELAAHDDKQELEEYSQIDQVQKALDLEPLLAINSTPKAGHVSNYEVALDSRESMSTAKESAEDMQVSKCPGAAPAVAASHNKHTLHDLLQSSPHTSNRSLACDCTSEMLCDNDDYFYSTESPDIHSLSTSCNNINCNTKSVPQRSRRRRPSLLMPRLPHSFSNAMHHLPHLPHSFSHALHHLPHSLSNALHHLPHLPHSLSNAFHQIAHLTHSLSSAYRHHVASRSTSDNVGASSSRHAHVHAHKQSHIPSHLHQLFSFKMHHSSPAAPDIIAVGETSPTAGYQSLPSPPPAMQLVHNHSKSPSPCRERRISASSDYMLIYSSAKKHSSKGIVHHHHHHHYHHYHFIRPGEESL